ncbi:MAG: hypothetical protein IT578_05960, partial [Verrucomicrobiae bacterium]|nr:hypothetical protein [Verrucomicrobiae bacterium]
MFWVAVLFLGAAGVVSAQNIEELQRAYQDRYHALTGGYVVWPLNSSGVASAMPTDGFYAVDMQDATKAAKLVADLAGKVRNSFILSQALDVGGAGLVNAAGLPTRNEQRDRIPLPSDITAANYAEFLPLLAEQINRLSMKPKLSNSVGGSDGGLTITASQKSRSYIVAYDDSHYCPPPGHPIESQTGGQPVSFHPNLGQQIQWGDSVQSGNCVDWLGTIYAQYNVQEFCAGSVSVGGSVPAVTGGCYFVRMGYDGHDLFVPLQGAIQGGSSASIRLDAEAGAAPHDLDGRGYWYWLPPNPHVISIDGLLVANVTPVPFDTCNALSGCPTVSAAREGDAALQIKCNGATCIMGRGIPANKSLDYSLNLGRSYFGQGGGRLFIKAFSADASLATPQALHYEVSGEDVQVVVTNGGPRQVRMPGGLADVVTNSATSYAVRFYDPTQVGT